MDVANISEYKYTLKKTRRDGSIAEYDVIIQYTPKKQPINNIDKIEIRRKLNEGVTKKRICSDYGISFHTLQKLLVEG